MAQSSSPSRRTFIKTSALHAIGIGLAAASSARPHSRSLQSHSAGRVQADGLSPAFIPVRAASWWCELEDLLWPQKKIIDRIQRRAKAFAHARIDTAINFGFHIRFDFADYFDRLHGYYADVCEALHRYDIKFMDHYSCNHVERPRGKDELIQLHKNQRHHVLLFHDPLAADHAQYEGHLFNDLCQVDLRSGGRGYAKQYQMEAFCHNNPAFWDMHQKYLQRLLREVPLDGIEVDDMCDYAGLVVCGCRYCRERFQQEYGRDLPPLEDAAFWGDTSSPDERSWGNYENPAFREWIQMKAVSVADHLRRVKETVGDKPLMTCCSSSGPMLLNALALNLERMSPWLDFFMLENCGINVNSVEWVRMDAEALHQKDIAGKKNYAPAMALSYTIYEKGAYLGWCLSRFWGVANWSSTLNQRLEEDPADRAEIENLVGRYNNWEIDHSNWNYRDGVDLVEVRLVNSRYCRENGWRRQDGQEQWDQAAAWSAFLVKANIGYRFVRCEELADPVALCSESTPLILDSLGCVSDAQWQAIKTFLSRGGMVWLRLPFGTHDERGYKRKTPLSDVLLTARYKNLILIPPAGASNPVDDLVERKAFRPVLQQVDGDRSWAARIRFYRNQPVIHLLNTGLIAVPHPDINDGAGVPVLKDVDALAGTGVVTYRIDTEKFPLSALLLKSPEIDGERKVDIRRSRDHQAIVHIDLTGVKMYAVMQPGP